MVERENDRGILFTSTGLVRVRSKSSARKRKQAFEYTVEGEDRSWKVIDDDQKTGGMLMLGTALFAHQPCSKYHRMSKIMHVEFGLRPSFGVRGDESDKH